MSDVLRIDRVRLRHPAATRDAVRDVSLALSIAPPEILVLIGPNGSGKSTTLAALGRGLAPHAGRVLLGDRPLFELGARDFARHVARLVQAPLAPDGLTVESLVASGRHAHRSPFGRSRPDDLRCVRDALVDLDLQDLRHRPIEALSGGERRRAWLAVAFAQHARALLLDEPTSNLDLRAQHEVLSLLARLHRERGLAMAIVLHDLEHAASLADRIAVLHRGRLYDVGPPEQVLREDMLRDVYGVDARVFMNDGRVRVQVRGISDPIRHLT